MQKSLYTSVNPSGIHTYERQAASDRASSLCPEPCCQVPKQKLSYPHPDPQRLRVLHVLVFFLNHTETADLLTLGPPLGLISLAVPRNGFTPIHSYSLEAHV